MVVIAFAMDENAQMSEQKSHRRPNKVERSRKAGGHHKHRGDDE